MNNLQNTNRPLAVLIGHKTKKARDFAKKLAQRGHDLIFVASNPSVCEEAEKMKELGVNAESIQINLASKNVIDTVLGRISETGRAIKTVVIYNDLSPGEWFEKKLAEKILEKMENFSNSKLFYRGDISLELIKKANKSGIALSTIY